MPSVWLIFLYYIILYYIQFFLIEAAGRRLPRWGWRVYASLACIDKKVDIKSHEYEYQLPPTACR